MKKCFEKDVELAVIDRRVRENLKRLISITKLSERRIAAETGVTSINLLMRGEIASIGFMAIVSLSRFYNVDVNFFMIEHSDHEIFDVANNIKKSS